MKAKSLLGSAALSALLLCNAPGTTLLSDNFDSYADQAAFVTAWPAQVGTGGTLSTAQAVSGPNSINFPTTAQRNGRSFAESLSPSSGNVIVFSIDFFDSNAAAAPYRQSVSLVDGAGTASGQLIALGLNNNLSSSAQGGNFFMARIVGYTPPGQASGDFFKLNDDPLLLRTTGWHNLRVEISDVEFRFFVDGSLAEVVPNTVTVRSYDSVRLGSGVTSTNEIFIDNVMVQTVPEPGAVSLCILGGAALCFARMRRRR